MRVTRRLFAAGLAVVVALPLLLTAREQPGARYFPAAGEWERRDPSALGLDPARLDAAVKAALATENQNP